MKIAVFSILFVVFGMALAKTKELNDGPKIYSDAVMACQQLGGGMCVSKGECPPENLANPVLQTQFCDEGQECCHSLPGSTQKCEDRHGDCVAAGECGTVIIDRKGHCEQEGQVCCVRV